MEFIPAREETFAFPPFRLEWVKDYSMKSSKIHKGLLKSLSKSFLKCRHKFIRSNIDIPLHIILLYVLTKIKEIQ